MSRSSRTELARCYCWPLVSLIALASWFSPWLFEPRKSLGLYIAAFFWFFIAWVVVAGQLVAALVLRKRGAAIWRHQIVAAAIHLSCYAGLLWGLANGYLVTV